MRRLQISIGALAAGRFVWACVARAEGRLDRISHIVVLYMENRSFDDLLGAFPGANGVERTSPFALQRNADGTPFDILPSVMGPFEARGNPPEVRQIALEPLPNGPFAIDAVDPRGSER
jgi:phospholipase C